MKNKKNITNLKLDKVYLDIKYKNKKELNDLWNFLLENNIKLTDEILNDKYDVTENRYLGNLGSEDNQILGLYQNYRFLWRVNVSVEQLKEIIKPTYEGALRRNSENKNLEIYQNGKWIEFIKSNFKQ